MKSARQPTADAPDTGLKPSVAFKNQAIARENISTKLKVLGDLCKRFSVTSPLPASVAALRERVLPLLPRTLRQFNHWTSDAFQGWDDTEWPVFKRNANHTLRVSGLRDDVVSGLSAVGLLEADVKGIKASAAIDRAAALRRKVELANRLRAIAESELKAMMRNARDLKGQVQSLQARIAAIERETAAALSSRDAVISELRASMPKSSAGKVSVLAPVKQRGRKRLT
ncbi:hypothetical protein J2W35_006428 [Variovorax boronicumulans]|uniref:hypothetical protein n=1 Tax=Variovorax boronicumulans TaxID=436515 RepID=UPI0027814F96|nr:hypothetical protein [Variovorax boronicumulans]MDQ0086047.1 hypothetical protein [Variovorax boronicumulans]